MILGDHAGLHSGERAGLFPPLQSRAERNTYREDIKKKKRKSNYIPMTTEKATTRDQWQVVT